MSDYLLVKDDTGYWKDLWSGEYFDFDSLVVKHAGFDPADVESVLLYLSRAVGDAYFTLKDGNKTTFNIFEFDGGFEGFEAEFNACSVGTNPGTKPQDPAPSGTDYVALVGDSVVDVADGVVDAVSVGLPVILGLAVAFVVIGSVWGVFRRLVR